jgi:hypothetical protein
MTSPFWHKYHLNGRILPLIVVIGILKYALITIDWQPLPLSALVTAAVSADVFLLGFLIAGSLPDYKEAERLPSEIAASIDALVDECLVLRINKPERPEGNACLQQLAQLVTTLKTWFHQDAPTGEVMTVIRNLNTSLAAFEPLTQANFIVRMKQEQQMLRRLVLRVRTIREVSFVSTGYAIGEVFTLFVIVMLLLTQISGMLNGLFFTAGFSYLLIYMIALVKDLDNPFHYHQKGHHDDEIDTAPLVAVEKKILLELNEASKPVAKTRGSKNIRT